jgi:DNA-binding LytR/AlgR family response regulator
MRTTGLLKPDIPDKSYDISLTDNKGTSHFIAHLFRLEDQFYLDFFPTDISCQNDLAEIHLVPTHSLAKIDLSGGKITIRWYNEEWLIGLFNKNKIRIAHERVPYDPDLIFLDINLPRLSGLNFLKTLDRPPMVIFTTAYPEYTVEGFEANAVDYLVKSFSFERFLKAINKAIEKARYSQNQAETQLPDSRQDFILLRADKKLYNVLLSEIHYIEATGDYLKVFYADKHLVVHGTVNGFLEKFPRGEFIRVHKSFIVSVNQINYIEGNQIRIGSIFIPIGRSYKEEVERRLNQR